MVHCQTILRELERQLRQVNEHHLSSRSLADWSDAQYWYLQEKLGQKNTTAEANFLREIFYDIVTQWECLVANAQSTSVEFPPQLLSQWLFQTQEYLVPGLSLLSDGLSFT